MTLRDPRDVEREIDQVRAEIERVLGLSDADMPAEDRRDSVMRATGRVTELERVARELREHEVAALRSAVPVAAAPVEGAADDAKAAAFRAYVASGDIRNANLVTTPDANGGYLMPDKQRAAMIDYLRKSNPLYEDATVFTLSKPGTFSVRLPRKTGVTSGGWVAETAARAATNAPTFGEQVLNCHEWYANPLVSQSFLDAVDGGEQVVLDDIRGTFAEVCGTGWAVGTGDGNTQPTGLFTGTSFYTTKTSSTAGALDAAQILSAYFALPARYLPGAAFYAKPATFATLSALAWPNLSNTPLMQWQNGTPSIMGKRIVMCDDAPAVGAANYPMAFGDLGAGYAIGVHTQVSVLRDPYSNKPYVGFYATGRVGGVPWDPNAVLLLKSNNS